jgi:PIF1-like helicase
MLCDNECALILSIYETMVCSINPPSWQYFRDHIILAARNEDVHMLNRRILCLLCGNHQLYISTNTHSFEPGTEQHEQDIPVEFLHSLNASGLPLAYLKLKEGCPIVLLCNLDSKQGLCNGTRAIIIRMSHCILEVCLIGGDHDGKLALIPWITLSPSVQGFNFSVNLK